jgi:hypothetical protein
MLEIASIKFKLDFEKRVLTKIVIDKNNCWEFSKGKNYGGYGISTLEHKQMLVHRASYKYHFGSIPEGLHILHRCDNPPCCNPDHLFAGTNLDNIRDKMEKGRQKGNKGGDHPESKLKETDVINIFLSSESIKELAKQYNVEPCTISNIRNSRSWGHITELLRLNKNTIIGKGSKITKEDVKDIYLSKESTDSLMLLYPLTRESINNIKGKRTWKTYTDYLDNEIII